MQSAVMFASNIMHATSSPGTPSVKYGSEKSPRIAPCARTMCAGSSGEANIGFANAQTVEIGRSAKKIFNQTRAKPDFMKSWTPSLKEVPEDSVHDISLFKVTNSGNG